MMQKRGSWSTAIGLIVAALLMVPGLAPAAEKGPYFGIGGTFAKQDFDTGDLDQALAAPLPLTAASPPLPAARR